MTVSSKKEEALSLRMVRLGIDPKTVIEKFIRGSGSGGQKINKTANCVYLKHLPTGIEVKLQKERSRSLNRFLAWRLLCDKIAEKKKLEVSARKKRAAKIKRQKRRRSRRAKEKMLKDKKITGQKKRLRSKVKVDED